MQPRRLIIYCAQALLLAAAAVAGGTAVRQGASATTTTDPVITLHVAPARLQPANLPDVLAPLPPGEDGQAGCRPVRLHRGDPSPLWWHDGTPGDERYDGMTGS
jgi:hypothetical protein